MKRAAAPAAMSAIYSVLALRGRGAASGVLLPICQQSRKLGPVRGGEGGKHARSAGRERQ